MFLQAISALHIALGSRCEKLMKDGPSPVTCSLHKFEYGASFTHCDAQI